MKEKDTEKRIQKALNVLGHVPERQADAATRGREIFLKQAAALRTSGNASHQKGNIPGLVNVTRKQPGLVFKGVMAIVVALVILFGGTGLTVYASQSSLPHQSLYRLKLISEDIIISLAGSPQIQIAHSLNFADRRLEEISALMNRRETIPEFVADRIQNELNLAITLSASLGDQQMLHELEQIHLRIQTQLQTVDTLMENSITDSPLLMQIQTRIREQLRLCELGLSDPQGLRLQIQQRQQQHNGWDLTSTPTMQGQQTPQATSSSQWNWNATGCGTQQPTSSGTTLNNGCGTESGPIGSQSTTTPSQNGTGPNSGTPQSGGESGNKP
jgi:hypothetical protein